MYRQINRIAKFLYISMTSKPLFSFGLITDVQYADVEDGMNYRKTRHRYYRKSLKCLQDAIDYWNTNEDTSFVLQLGDLLDGFCQRTGTKHKAMKVLTETLQKYPKPIAHCWGNHEFYNFFREELKTTVLYPGIRSSPEVTSEAAKVIDKIEKFQTSSKMKNDNLCCYYFSPHPGYIFVVLDCYDISLLGRNKTHPKTIKANNILCKMNPNVEKNDHTTAVEPKYVKYNGGISDEQLEWLEDILKNSEIKKEKVVICGHIPIHPNATSGKICLVWNNDKILKLVEKFLCVLAYFAGHDHEGASYFFDNGIHHRTFEPVLEAVPKCLGGNETAFATIDMYSDRMEIRGVGDVKSSTLNF